MKYLTLSLVVAALLMGGCVVVRSSEEPEISCRR